MIIKAQFPDYSKIYNYKTNDLSIKADDYAVIDTPSQGYTVVKVIEVVEGNGDNLKRVVCRVNDEDYRKAEGTL